MRQQSGSMPCKSVSGPGEPMSGPPDASAGGGVEGVGAKISTGLPAATARMVDFSLPRISVPVNVERCAPPPRNCKMAVIVHRR